MLDRILPEMAAMGFELTPLGGNSYAVNAVPAGLDGLDVVSLLGDMVSDAVEKGTTVQEQINQSLALSLARHAAIPYGQILNNGEMENLVNELFACSNVNYTPDGRPVLTILQQREIERLFGG
jgi:DNA mismatch repair protein MutL